MILSDDMPAYTIGVIADLLRVHPETLRIWERHKLVRPVRRKGHRLYSANDLRRLRFIRYLTEQKGLNLAGVRALVDMYPCWWLDNCPGGTLAQPNVRTRVCWKEEGTYCQMVLDKADLCSGCRVYENQARCASCSRLEKDSRNPNIPVSKFPD